jgi:hypothetical protein
VQPRRQADVLPYREISDEAAGDLDEGRHAAVDRDGPLILQEHARDELQKRALALTVPSDHADRLTGSHVEADVAQRPEFTRLGTTR